jgi:hypothetical protein
LILQLYVARIGGHSGFSKSPLRAAAGSGIGSGEASCGGVQAHAASACSASGDASTWGTPTAGLAKGILERLLALGSVLLSLVVLRIGIDFGGGEVGLSG